MLTCEECSSFDIQGRCKMCGKDCSEYMDALLEREAKMIEEYYSHLETGDIEYDLAHGGCMVAFVAEPREGEK